MLDSGLQLVAGRCTCLPPSLKPQPSRARRPAMALHPQHYTLQPAPPTHTFTRFHATPLRSSKTIACHSPILCSDSCHTRQAVSRTLGLSARFYPIRPTASLSPIALSARLPPSLTQRHGSGSVACNAFKPVEALEKELDVQSNQLDDNVRQRVEQAVEALGYRVTVGDVAARAGVKLNEAENALKALVYDSLGNLEVSPQGELLYVFPTDFQSKIRNKSLLLRSKPVWDAVRSGAMYLVRVGFGVTLIASVLLVTFAILVLLNSRDDRDRRGNNNSMGGGMGGMRVWLDISNLFYFFDPYYYRARRRRADSGNDMSFVESIFSFVFGDGDPNSNFDERRWKLLGRYIQSRGGVVVAEEIAPFLDPESGPETDSDSTYVDERVVLPALIKFGGEPFVDENGNILYRFPSLQQTAQGRLAPAPAERSVQEETWELSNASKGQKLGAGLLGGFNIFGVGVLSSMLAEGVNKAVLAANGLGFVPGLMPALQLYAAGFFTIPAVRWFVNQTRNAAIDARNLARLQFQRALERPSPKLRQKLDSARKQGSNRVLTRSDTIYKTDRDLDDQLPAQDFAEFDRKLRVQGEQDGKGKTGRGGKEDPVLWRDWVGGEDGPKKVRRGRTDNTGGW